LLLLSALQKQFMEFLEAFHESCILTLLPLFIKTCLNFIHFSLECFSCLVQDVEEVVFTISISSTVKEHSDDSSTAQYLTSSFNDTQCQS